MTLKPLELTNGTAVVTGGANGIGKGTLAIPTGKQIRIPMNTDDIINEFNAKVEERVV